MTEDEQRLAVIGELQQIRADRRTYQAHKEATVYIAVALSIGILNFLVTESAKGNVWLSWSAFVGLLLNHLFIRWQLRLRRIASAFHWVVEKIIAKAIAGDISGSDLVVDTEPDDSTDSRKRFSFSRLFSRYAFGEQLVAEDAKRLLTFRTFRLALVDHCSQFESQTSWHRMKRSMRGDLQGGELPTIASILIIFFALLYNIGVIPDDRQSDKSVDHSVPYQDGNISDSRIHGIFRD